MINILLLLKLINFLVTIKNKKQKNTIKNKKIQAFDSSYFHGKSHFEGDGTQTYLVFQPVHKCFKRLTNSNKIVMWKSRRFLGESIKSPATTDNVLSLRMLSSGTKLQVKIDGSCLNQEKVTFNHKNIVNMYIAYEINFW